MTPDELFEDFCEWQVWENGSLVETKYLCPTCKVNLLLDPESKQMKCFRCLEWYELKVNGPKVSPKEKG